MIPSSRQKYFPNAPESQGKKYYVAQHHPQAADTNPGTQDLPFKTISKAASVADMYDTVIIGAGTYREQVPLVRHGGVYEPESLIVFKAAPGAEVYLKGSDIFKPRWQDTGHNVFKANLPEFLFKPGSYNPYELSGAIDNPGKVRPAKGEKLPETLGQIYVDGEALEQLNTLQSVQETPGTFIVSADGRELFVHFAGEEVPKDKMIELTVRERCFKAEFSEFGGMLFIQTMGIAAEHAANPGAFSRCRPLTIRENPGKNVIVRKTFSLPSNKVCCTLLASQISYTSKDKNNQTLISALGTSKDKGRTWTPIEPNPKRDYYGYFLDEENGILYRHFRKVTKEVDREGEYGGNTYDNFQQVSRDEGKRWSEPERVDWGKAFGFRMLKLRNGKLLWVTVENTAKIREYYGIVKTWLGTWRKDLSGIDWKLRGILEAEPGQSGQGLDEPHACQFPDGRIFAIFRQASIIPSQEAPGFPSVKLFAVSEDDGKTWSKPKPLTYDDGKYVYSPCSMPDTICSSKNGKVYVVVNINDRSNPGCDPRTTLNIAELDTRTCRVKKDTVAVIDTKHGEHHFFVRFSNWSMIEDRNTKNLLLFMKLDMCETCPIRYGYDLNCYRYEIRLPD